MKKMIFSGYSDDNATYKVVDANGKVLDHDEVGCYDRAVIFHIKSAVAEQRLAVVSQYAPHDKACWVFGVGLIDDGDARPEWPIRMVAGDTEYAIGLEIEVPDDATLEVDVARKKGS